MVVVVVGSDFVFALVVRFENEGRVWWFIWWSFDEEVSLENKQGDK